MNQMIIYQFAMPLLAVIFLLFIWNEIRKRGDKVDLKLAKEYRWNRCFVDGRQGIIILELEISAKKNREITIQDSSLEVVRNFQFPIIADHVPTIVRAADYDFMEEDFLFAGSNLVFDRKGQIKQGLDVFLTNNPPGRGKRMEVVYSWFDEKWRRHSRRFRIYVDRGGRKIVL